jgi:hypothetical protein
MPDLQRDDVEEQPPPLGAMLDEIFVAVLMAFGDTSLSGGAPGRLAGRSGQQRGELLLTSGQSGAGDADVFRAGVLDQKR